MEPQGVLSASNVVEDYGFKTYKGHLVDLKLGPTKEQVDVEDIAHHLSLQCRFGGACRHFYSVAEHSVLVARHAMPQWAVYFLLHDAAEYIGQDITGPMKRLIWGMDYKNNPAYKKIFDKFDKQILEALDLNYGKFKNLYSDIKQVDNLLYKYEKQFLFGHGLVTQFPEGESLHGAGFGLEPIEAEKLFLSEFYKYMA